MVLLLMVMLADPLVSRAGVQEVRQTGMRWFARRRILEVYIHYTAGLWSPSVPPTGPLMGELGHRRGRVWFHRARGKDEAGLGKLQLVARYFGKADAVGAKTGADLATWYGEREALVQSEARGKLKPGRDVVLAICEHHFMTAT
jgi:hypothetical protein